MSVRQQRNDLPHAPKGVHWLSLISLDDVEALTILVANDDADFERIVVAMRSQAAIAALMIRTANSIALNSGRGVRSLRHALAILGLERIREILAELKHLALERSYRTAS